MNHNMQMIKKLSLKQDFCNFPLSILFDIKQINDTSKPLQNKKLKFFVTFWATRNKINSQSLEDTQVGYISQKYTLDKYTLEKYT